MIHIFKLLPFFTIASFAAELTAILPPDKVAGCKLSWSDEFVGAALNKAEWNIRTCVRFASANMPGSVSVADGLLRLTVRKEKAGDAEYTSGGVISKREFTLKTAVERISRENRASDGGVIFNCSAVAIF